MKLNEAEQTFLKNLAKSSYKLGIEICHNLAYKNDVDIAEALEKRGLCETTFSVSKGFSAVITQAGEEALQSI